MIAVLETGCPMRHKAEVVRLLESEGLRAQVSESEHGTVVGVVGTADASLARRLEALPGVREVRMTAPPYPLVARAYHPETSVIRVNGVSVGGPELMVAAGPCAVEDERQLLTTARAVAKAGARLLRGGAFKPRSSPYSFQGLGEEGLRLLSQARAETGLAIVTEVLAPEDVELVAHHADLLQIGARNMQNFRLLSAVGAQPRPVLLKRGMMATIDELLLAAEYVAAAGNPGVILCERGIRTFETATRGTLDLSAVPVLRELTHLPIIVDPSHAAGKREWVPALSRAAVAAGADGLIVEVHPEPDRAVSDGRQSLTLPAFAAMMDDLRRVAAAMDRTLESGEVGERTGSGTSSGHFVPPSRTTQSGPGWKSLGFVP